MQNSRFLPVLLALVLLTGAAITGCQTIKRQNSDALRESAEKAKRLCEKALALMSNPHYLDKTSGLAAPMPSLLPGAGKAEEAVKTRTGLEQESERLQVADVEEFNPQALEDLQTAQKTLEEALQANGQAGEAEKALARSWLANVYKLRAQYFRGKGFVEARKMPLLLEQADRQLNAARVQAVTVKHYDTMLGLGTSKVEELLTGGKQGEDRLVKESAQLQADIAELIKKTQQLTTEVEQERAQTAQTVTESRLTADAAAMERFDKAMAVNEGTDKKYSELQDLEFKLDGKKAELKENELQLGLVRAQIAAASETLKVRQGNLTSTQDASKQAKEALAKAREAIIPALAGAVKAYEASQESAIKSLSLTADALKQLGQATSSDPSAAASAEQGSLNMDLGMLNQDLRINLQRLTTGLQTVEQAWKDLGGDKPLPAAPKASAEDYRKAAVTAYKDAVTSYEKAISSLRQPAANNIRWVYQGSEAAACLALAGVSPEDAAEAKSKAQDLQQKALSQREASPYLSNVSKLGE